MEMVCITGGIGSGKSVVSRVLRLKGYEVYDCDSRAKELMDASETLKCELEKRAGVTLRAADGCIDRHRMAEVLFGDDSFRRFANGMIHSMVRDDIRGRLGESESGVLFVETAIPVTSGLDRMADGIWLVDAPEDVRIDRVMRRNGVTAQSVAGRIRTQHGEFDSLPAARTSVIRNYGSHSLLLQIDRYLESVLHRSCSGKA